METLKQNLKSDEVEDRQEEIKNTNKKLDNWSQREKIQKATENWPYG